MAAPIVQARYDDLEEFGARFGRQAEAASDLDQALRTAFQPLVTGGWRGEAADAFAHEMDGALLPAIRRLIDALAEAREVTLRCGALLREAEAEAAALFAAWSVAATNAEAGRDATPQPGPSGSDTGLAGLLGGARPPDLSVLLPAIHQATVEQRQAILNDPALRARITQRYGPEGTVVMAALLEGALFWPGGSGPNASGRIDADTSGTIPDPTKRNDFAAWMLGGPNPPSTLTGQMNCWESIMFAAYLNGQITEEQLRALHQTAADAFVATEAALANPTAQPAGAEPLPPTPYAGYRGVLAAALGADDATPWHEGAAPLAGSLIFFQTPGNQLAHVALATGRTVDGQTEILSLWNLPKSDVGAEIRTMQLTTVETMREAMKPEKDPPAVWVDIRQGDPFHG